MLSKNVEKKALFECLVFLKMSSHLGKGLPVTPSLTTGLAATLSSPPMLFVAEHLYNDDVHDHDDDSDGDGDDDELSHLHNPWCW